MLHSSEFVALLRVIVIGRCIQVLTVVKHRLDNYLVTVSNYESLLIQATQYLAWRDEVTYQGADGVTRRDSILSLPSNSPQRPALASATGKHDYDYY